MTPKKATHRLTLSEIVERQLATVGSGNGDHSSVKLTLNARGETQIEVKVTTAEQGTGGTVDGASELAQGIYDALTTKYTLEPEPGE